VLSEHIENSIGEKRENEIVDNIWKTEFMLTWQNKLYKILAESIGNEVFGVPEC